MRYLDTSELIAVEHINKVITAHTLTDADLSAAAGKRLRDAARAIRLYAEVREYAEAVRVAEELRRATQGATSVTRVLDRAIKTLQRSLR